MELRNEFYAGILTYLAESADVGFDFYRTDFQNQAVVDVMQSPQQVLFYNLKGKSFANSLQMEFNYELQNISI